MNKLKTTYTATPKNDWKDRIEVEVGDAKQDDFYPQTKIMRWDNEANFSVRLKDEEDGVASISEKDDKVTWDKGNFKIEFYEVESAHKFVWYLKKKPKTNKVQFTIQSKGLKFAYQPELTQKEKDEGASRPENVVGSYAVKMENPGTNWVGGTEYKNSKIGHIYRPHLYDSNGLEAWGDLHIENGKYEVTIPQEFLDKAVYPIKSNDTFGYAGEGGSWFSLVGGATGREMSAGSLFTSPSNIGETTKMSAYVNNYGGSHASRTMIVLESNLEVITNGCCNQRTSGSDGDWEDWVFSTNPTPSGNTDYLVMITSNGMGVAYDSGDTNQGYVDDQREIFFGCEDLDSGNVVNNNNEYSVYATYTAAATITGPFPTFQRP